MNTTVCISLTMGFVSVMFLLSSTHGQFDGPCDDVPSETWKELCFHSDHCNTHCVQKKGALSGKWGFLVCNCNFDCKNTCQKPSGLWKGLCVNSPGCARQCREKENSVRGGCIGGKCMCFYTCETLE